MKVHFIWGQGGVGKSHVALKTVASLPKPALLITLDPSLRILDLISQNVSSLPAEVTLLNEPITVKTTNAADLFQRLNARIPAHPSVQLFYERMANGLQEFRDYLHLLQLSDELKESHYQHIVIDTPPFQEALGLHLSARKLKNFFSQSLVQFAMKTAQVSWLQTTVKRVFEVTRVFVGKQAATQVFDFVEYLAQHTDRFTSAALRLESLFFSPETNHHFVVTPETGLRHLAEIQEGFSFCDRPRFRVNRSCRNYSSDELLRENCFTNEIRRLKTKEASLSQELKRLFPKAEISSIPFILMGEDTPEELRRYLKLPEQADPLE